MQSHKKLMIDSLWKLNVADIEATLSRVCQMVLQDTNVKKEELRARAKGLKTLGKIFQRAKSVNENETETAINSPLHELKGDEPVYDAFSLNTPAKSPNADHMPPTFSSQSPYVEAPQFSGGQFNYSFPMPTALPDAQRHV